MRVILEVPQQEPLDYLRPEGPQRLRATELVAGGEP